MPENPKPDTPNPEPLKHGSLGGNSPGETPGRLLRRSPNDLVSLWQQYDWRENIFAPGICILQALTASGETASGAGSSRETAFQRCLAETAELDALGHLENAPDGTVPAFKTTRDGIAAGADPGAARARAILETVERAAIAAWWNGALPLHAVPDDWLDRAGLVPWLEKLRTGAAIRRDTGLWWHANAGLHIMVARSTDTAGQHCVLGYGCAPDPGAAARKAIREVILMELNLIEIVAARVSRDRPEDPRINALRQRMERQGKRCKQILSPRTRPPAPNDTSGALIDAAQTCLGAAITPRDITPRDGPISVILCQPDTPPPGFDTAHGSPF